MLSRAAMKKRVIIALALALIISLAITASVRRSVTTDEFGSIWLASQSDPSFIVRKVLESDIHPPTPYLLLHYWGKAFGYGDLPMRLPSLLAVLLSLLVIRRLVQQLQPQLSEGSQNIALALAMSAPVLWIQASSARYYALGTLAGLCSTSTYLSWIQKRGTPRWCVYVLITAAAFYIHYLLAALLVIAQAVHFAVRGVRTAGLAAVRAWLLAQASIAVLAVPVILWSALPLLTGERSTLGNQAHEGLTGPAAFPIVLSGHLYTVLTGGVPFPWDFWVTLPVVLAAGGALALDLKHHHVSISADMLCLVILPFVLLAVVAAILLPIAGFFQGVLRAGHVAVLCWVFIAVIVARIQDPLRQRLIAGLLIAVNAYILTVYGLNLFSMAQPPPLNTMAQHIRSQTPTPATTLVFHPFEHGWGDAMSRYLPGFRCEMAVNEQGVTLSEVQAGLAKDGSPSTLWLVQRNRFAGSALDPLEWLTSNGYTVMETVEFQRQSAFDLRIKEALKRIPQLRYSPAPSQRFIWTLRRLDHTN
jgi:hypothetical protein